MRLIIVLAVFVALVASVSSQLLDENEPKNFFTCSMCKELVSFAAQFLGEDESTIQQKLDEFCSHLGPLASTCKGLIDTSLPIIIDGLQNGETADEICKAIKMCSSQAKKVSTVKLMPANNSVKSPMFGKCEICKVIVDAVQGLLGLGEGEIIKELDKVCSHIPFVSSECKDLVNQYVDKIIQYLQDGKTTDEVCELISLCSKFDQVLTAQIHEYAMTMVEELKAKRQPKYLNCNLCTEIAKEVGKYLNDDESVIVKNLKSYCDNFDLLTSTCKKWVDEYVPKMIAYLQNGQSDKAACQAVGLCN